jgi:hypothetical protein
MVESGVGCSQWRLPRASLACCLGCEGQLGGGSTATTVVKPQPLRWRVGYRMLTRQYCADNSFPMRVQAVARVERARSSSGRRLKRMVWDGGPVGRVIAAGGASNDEVTALFVG